MSETEGLDDNLLTSIIIAGRRNVYERDGFKGIIIILRWASEANAFVSIYLLNLLQGGKVERLLESGHVYDIAMGLSDKALGGLMLLTAAFVFTYYTTWALILPLLPVDSGLHEKFPPREWAVRLPAAILLVGITAIGGFMGMVMMKEAQKKKAKRAGKSA